MTATADSCPPMRIAVQMPGAGFERRWPEFLRAHGAEPVPVDLRSPTGRSALNGCHGVMWHWMHTPADKQMAADALWVIEHEYRLPIFPDQATRWSFDDKIAQALWFEALGLPVAKSWVFGDATAAEDWASRATYPLVAKTSTGAGSTGVHRIASASEARAWIRRAFSRRGIWPGPVYPPGVSRARRGLEAMMRFGGRVLATPAFWFARGVPLPSPFWGIDKNLVLFQEFLPGNAYDTRVTIIGNRAFGFRRMNRPGDFRASGSGRIDYDPKGVDPRCVRLAFDAARKLRTQSAAFDILFAGPGGGPRIVEMCYGYLSEAVQACPGHWDEALQWHEGAMWPEEAHVIDYLRHVRSCMPFFKGSAL